MPPTKTSQQVRQEFLDFFVKRHGHAFVPSSPVVPHDDPTLLFTNAGMNQFKPIFLGQERRDYTRAANTQKCIRAGGKHNDLDDVGRSRRHHTFFEMLGNWSFGDYFKRGAIEMAWELLTQVYQLPADRLHVTCYEGDAAAGIPRDTEAAEIWKQVAGLPDDRIHYFGAKDNFWEMGPTGPCGPCTEINIDRRPQAEIDADQAAGRRAPVNGDDPRVMEIWNNVFIQYNRDATGTLTPLPAQHVDTGMGLERLCQVIQGKADNYATDLWSPLFEKITALSGIPYTGKYPPTNAADPVAEAADEQLRHDIAFRVVADHVRCLTFALTDGAVPSNDGRGYVLRRILRRAVRFGRQQLGLTEPFMHQLVPVIVESMGDAFPELRAKPDRVREIIKDEEVSFGRTLNRGMDLFASASMYAIIRTIYDPINPLGPVGVGTSDGEWLVIGEGNIATLTLADGRKAVVTGDVQDQIAVIRQHCKVPPVITAKESFKLHDTYGFPIDLTRIMAEERGMSVDIVGYERLMEEAKEKARSGGKTDDATKKLTDLPPAALSQLEQAGVRPTDDAAKYAGKPITATVLAIWNGDDLGLSPASASEDESLAIVLDQTNFYAEMGGQTGDAGVLASASMAFDVETTKLVGGFVLHVGRVRTGKIEVGQTVTATVADAREATEKNHTSTHLANWALREVLGDGVQQKGSLVDPEKLRFDFSHGTALADDEVERVESLVGAALKSRLPVYAAEVPQEQALKINGLRAVFGEKYPPVVRVVSVGVPVEQLVADPLNVKWRAYSVEFCGGTHLHNAGNAGSFVVTAEESVSKGIRRLTAVTGPAAQAATESALAAEAIVRRSQTAAEADLPAMVAALNGAIAKGELPLRAKRRAQAAVAELQAKAKAAEKAKAKGAGIDAAAVAADLLTSSADLGGGKLVVGEVAGAGDDELRSVLDSLRKRAGSYAVMLAASAGEKVTFIAAVSDDLIAKGLKAGDWVRETAKVAGGGGGGKPNMAQAGGRDPAKVGEALEKAKAVASAAVGG